MRIFVTGGTGFIGQALVRELARQGHQVSALARDPARAPAVLGVAWVGGDCALAGGLDGARRALGSAEAIAHLAAVRKDWALSEEELRRANVESGPRLLAQTGAARRFLLVSSVAVYGHPEGGAAREDAPFRPSKRYGISKAEAEAAMKEAASRSGMPLTIARPGIVYGPGDTYGMFANMARLIAHRRFLLVGPGDNCVNLLHAEDLARGLALALASPQAAGQDFIFAGPERVPVRRMAEVLAKETGRRLPTLRVPATPARLLAQAMEAAYRWGGAGREPFLTRAKIDLLTKEDVYDAGKAKDVLGFTPGIGLDEGAPPTVRWLAERGELA